MKYFLTQNFRMIWVVTLLSFFITHPAKAQYPTNNGINYLTDTSINFNDLIGKFKGRIIYVDIWATWCAPCRHELQLKKDMLNFQAFALKNNIVVLYICCDKNSNRWKQFINANKLTGYHILATPYINKEFHTTFSSIQTRLGKPKRSFYIPRHMIIDQTGMVADSTAAQQGSESAYRQLGKMLGKAAL
ncbi:TlpA family protein disulfide reductase [Mucilaginibacter sp.]|uniref:TlpA family protein disulfide reductase n=1 Tax=Mucilaginibacter sp. TaxID=1882438 RepID=UPI003D13EDFB